MKIVCFPHYTCGGLLCDILNNTFSPVAENGGIESIHHSIGKIGDELIYKEFDVNLLLNQLHKFKDHDVWIGTHCWLGDQDLSSFNCIINITTLTYKSRFYRWVRAYHHYYLKSVPWQNLHGMEEIDKQRETAKNYLEPFLPINHSRVINIEFADVVERHHSFLAILPNTSANHLNRWQTVNNFLYQENIWQSTAAKRFYEAEYEVLSNQYYQYN
jgi:hypothetical protein